MTSERRIEHPDLRLMNIDTGVVAPCAVLTLSTGGKSTIQVTAQDGQRFEVQSSFDFEEALAHLRMELEDAGLFLLCNRFRRDAFISGMSRGMSGGLACYIVVEGRGVEPERAVPSLGPAPADAVGTAAESEAHVAAWIVKGPGLRWRARMLVKQAWWKLYPGAKYS